MVRVVERRVEAVDAVAFGSGTVEPVDPATWCARMAAFRTDGVSVEMIRARPFRFTAADTAPADVALVMLAIGAGRIHGIGATGAFEAGEGDALLIDTGRPVTLWADVDVQLLRVSVARSEVPQHLLARPPMPCAVLAASPVLRASVAFASTVLRSSRDAAAADEPTVARSMIALQLGLLEESARQRIHRLGGTDRRGRIEAHIDACLADPALSPNTIARDFGLSLRSVHAAFDDADSTVAATIRLRRVEAVQRSLLAEASMPRLGELARVHGFRDRTHLSRSFRDVTGSVPRAWWEARRHRT